MPKRPVYVFTPAEARSVQGAIREINKWQTVLQHLRVLLCDGHELQGIYDFAPGGTELIPVPSADERADGANESFTVSVKEAQSGG